MPRSTPARTRSGSPNRPTRSRSRTTSRLKSGVMAKADYVCAHRLRVRWVEVDMQKVVFNGHYLTYIDSAIADYWRAIGLAYPEGYVDRYANDMFLRKAAVDYLGSARYEDELAVHCRVAKLGRSSMT